MNRTTTTPTVNLDAPAPITAKGDSIWETTHGSVLVDKAEIVYEGEKAEVKPGSWRYEEYHAKGYVTRQHISLEVSGPKLLPFWYTDSGAEADVAVVFKAGLLALTGASDLSLSWSEQGLQGDGSWNFDVNLFWK